MGNGRGMYWPGEGRATRQADGVAREISAARAHRGESRDVVAARARVSSDSVRRVELGDPHVQLNTLCAVGEAVGLDVVLRAYRTRASPLRDAGQLSILEMLTSIAHPSWHRATEVMAGDHGEAIDLCLFGALTIIAFEVDRLLLDFQDQYRRNALKREYLSEHHRRPVRLVMVIQDTDRNRRAVQAHRQFIETILPAGSHEILVALRTGKPLERDGILWIRPDRPPRPRRVVSVRHQD